MHLEKKQGSSPVGLGVNLDGEVKRLALLTPHVESDGLLVETTASDLSVSTLAGPAGVQSLDVSDGLVPPGNVADSAGAHDLVVLGADVDITDADKSILELPASKLEAGRADSDGSYCQGDGHEDEVLLEGHHFRFSLS